MSFDFSTITTSDVAQIAAAAGTFILAGLTLRYVSATRSMVSEMKETRLAQQQPEIILEFDNPRSIICDLVIRNIGSGAAFDVKVSFDPDPPYQETGMNLSELPLFQDLKFFAPDREFRFFYKTLAGRDSGPQAEDANLIAHVAFRDAANRRFERDIPLNPYIRWHLSQIEEKTVNDIVDQLSKIVKQLSDSDRSFREFDYRLTKDIEARVSSPLEMSRNQLNAKLGEIIVLWESIYSYDVRSGVTTLKSQLRRCAVEILQLATGLQARGELAEPEAVFEIVKRSLAVANATLYGGTQDEFHQEGKAIVELAKQAKIHGL